MFDKRRQLVTYAEKRWRCDGALEIFGLDLECAQLLLKSY